MSSRRDASSGWQQQQQQQQQQWSSQPAYGRPDVAAFNPSLAYPSLPSYPPHASAPFHIPLQHYAPHAHGHNSAPLAEGAWEGGGPYALPSPTPIYRRQNADIDTLQQQQQQQSPHHLPPIQQKIVPGGRAKVKPSRTKL